MDSGVVNEVLTALESLENTFSTFQSATFTESTWYGMAADNANNLINDKVKTKITDAKTKLNNLLQAIELAKECDDYKKKINQTKAAMASLDLNNTQDAPTYSYHQNNLNNYNSAYQTALSSLRSLCN